MSFFVGSGTHQERDNSAKLIKDNNYLYVLDLLTIAELVHRKCFEAVVKLIGRPLIPTTVKEHLLMLLELANTPRESASLHEDNGQLIMADTPPNYHENRLSFLLEMQNSINKYCDVVVTTGPQEVTEAHRLVAEALDYDSLDVVYLCSERNAILISEDGAFRLIATEAGVVNSMGVQPLLMEACNAGLITKDQYANLIVNKIDVGHDFVSIRAEDTSSIKCFTREAGQSDPPEILYIEDQELIQLISAWSNKQQVTNANDSPYYFFGYIQYRDDVGIVRRMTFCRRYNVGTKRFVDVNDPEYEYSD